jgi:hypothetical protein
MDSRSDAGFTASGLPISLIYKSNEPFKEQQIVTSMHRLIVGIVVWLAFGAAFVLLLGTSMFLLSDVVVLLSVVLAGSALLATFLLTHADSV